MIKRKQKICVKCGKPRFIFSKGRCKWCANKSYKKPKKKREKTGEADVFIVIWKKRPHVCTNCDAPLGDEMYSFFFAHIKSKGAHPELRL